MSNINFICDVCGREVQGISFVNGMKFCAKCYQETFGGTKDCQHIEHKSQEKAQKATVGIKQCDKCEYYLRCEECCIDYDKKELIKIKQQLAITEKALELACEDINSLCREDKLKARTKLVLTIEPFGLGNLEEHFKEQAKEMLKNEII